MNQQSWQSSSDERPLGITIMAVLIAIFAVFSVCGSLAAIGFAPFQLFHTGIGGIFGSAIDGVIGLVLAVLNLIIAEGLWRLRSWAFVVTVVVEIFGVLHALGGGHIGTAILPILILAYMFLDGNVRRAFKM